MLASLQHKEIHQIITSFKYDYEVKLVHFFK